MLFDTFFAGDHFTLLREKLSLQVGQIVTCGSHILKLLHNNDAREAKWMFQFQSDSSRSHSENLRRGLRLRGEACRRVSVCSHWSPERRQASS